MRHPLLPLLALALLASPAAAGTSPPGVNLNWDRCFGDGSVQYKQFACDTNTGSERLVGSFELAQDWPGVTGIEITLDLGSLSDPLPAWWRFFNAGSCRQTALTAVLVPPTGAAACVDWAQGEAAGGVAGYQTSVYGNNRMRLKLGTAVAIPHDLFAGQEYFQFTLNIAHARTVGTGACSGCTDPVVIFLSLSKVVAGLSGMQLLNRGANDTGSQWVSWQNGYPANVTLPEVCVPGSIPPDHCLLNQETQFSVVPYPATPARTSTWGALKARYR